MKKFSILDLIISYIIIQGFLAGLYRFEVLNSLIIVLIPTILMLLFFIIFGLTAFVMYRYINYGAKIFTKRRRNK